MKRGHKTVKSTWFHESEFFRPNDRSQVKYEMLRIHCHEGRFITRVCEEFGYSLEAFCKEGLKGLVDKAKGKTKPDKVTPEIIGYVIYQRAKFGLSGAAIAEKVCQQFRVKLHKRSVISRDQKYLNLSSISSRGINVKKYQKTKMLRTF